MVALRAAGSTAVFDESIYGKTAFGRPMMKDENLFGLGYLGASTEEKYSERARRYYGTYVGLVTRIGRVASKEERSRLIAMVGSPRRKGDLAYTASAVDDDIRTADRWVPTNALIWSVKRRRNRVEALKAGVKKLDPAIREAEARVGILPQEQTLVREVIREVIVEKPSAPVPTPLPPSPPTVANTGPADQETGTTTTEAPGMGPLPLILGGVAVLGLGYWFLSRK